MMRPVLLVLAGLFGAGAAAAQTVLPRLYDVTGVDSALNVRAAPDTGSKSLGTLSREARDIEVTGLSDDRVWGRINFRESAGWVHLDFLAPQADPWQAGALPAGLRCFGTEPFWSLRVQGGALLDSRPGAEDRMLTIDSVHGGAGTPQRVIIAHGDEAKLTLGIAPEQCSDGMSDRSFALGARLSEGTDQPRSGCCSIAPQNVSRSGRPLP